MSSKLNDLKLPEDVIFYILLLLPVISLLRFKSVCKSWRNLIHSSDFIQHHLRHHHYDCPDLKDKNYNLIFPLPFSISPFTFLLTSFDNFEVPRVKLEVDSPFLEEYIPAIVDMAIFNGIICLNVLENLPGSEKNTVSLWNPATKQLRVVPQSPLPLSQLRRHRHFISVGFGFDVQTNDYKVVRLFTFCASDEKRVEVYNLSTDSWKTMDAVLPVDHVHNDARVPFRNGTRYCWWGNIRPGENKPVSLIFWFDFSCEVFRTIHFPNGYSFKSFETLRLSGGIPQLAIIRDNIGCILNVEISHVEIWVLNEYDVNEHWAKLYKFGPFLTPPRNMRLSKDGNYLFFVEKGDQLCWYDRVTGAIKNIPAQEFLEIAKGYPTVGFLWHHVFQIAEYKESLVSV